MLLLHDPVRNARMKLHRCNIIADQLLFIPVTLGIDIHTIVGDAEQHMCTMSTPMSTPIKPLLFCMLKFFAWPPSCKNRTQHIITTAALPS